jgi:hypothetical protein
MILCQYTAAKLPLGDMTDSTRGIGEHLSQPLGVEVGTLHPQSLKV